MLSDSICYIPPQKDNIQKAVIMLHGFGSNGYDLISMAPFISKDLPNTVFYSPDANIPMPETGGFRWFDLEENASTDFFTHFDYVQTLMERAKKSVPLVNEFINHICQKHSLDAEQIILMGFSQGGLMALMAGLTNPGKLGGIIACSAIPVMINNALELNDIKNKPNVLLTHGTDDDIVPFIGMQISLNTLSNIDCAIQSHTVPGMGHSIDESCIEKIISFIKTN